MKRLTPLLLGTLLFLPACHHQTLPDGILTEECMVDFLTDAYMLEGYYAIESRYRYDSVPEEALLRYDSILEIHNLSREQVEQSLDYYTNHLDRYQVIHDSVVARLERRQQQLTKE